MNDKITNNKKVLLKRIKSKIIFKFFSLIKLPMAIISGMKVETITEHECHTSVKYNYLNKNPFRSTYFAVLSMAAELSTGALALLSVGGNNSDISFIITNMKADFIKKATGKTIFICKEGDKLIDAANIAREQIEAKTQKVHTNGYNEDGELIANFEFTWSFKTRKETS